MNNTPDYSIESLYRKHFSSLVSYVRRNFPPLKNDAEDLVQSVFLELWEKENGTEASENPNGKEEA